MKLKLDTKKKEAKKQNLYNRLKRLHFYKTVDLQTEHRESQHLIPWFAGTDTAKVK